MCAEPRRRQGRNDGTSGVRVYKDSEGWWHWRPGSAPVGPFEEREEAEAKTLPETLE